MNKLTNQINQAIEAATPGPWEFMNNRDVFTNQGATNRTGITADHNDGWHICDIDASCTFVNGGLEELSSSEKSANGYLISNAPTWLAQLLQERELMVEALKFYSNLDTPHSLVAHQLLDQVGERD